MHACIPRQDVGSVRTLCTECRVTYGLVKTHCASSIMIVSACPQFAYIHTTTSGQKKCGTEKPKSLSSIPLQYRSSQPGRFTASPRISTPRRTSPSSFYTGPTPYHLVLLMLVLAETPHAQLLQRVLGFVCSPAPQPAAALALPSSSTST